MCGILRQLVSIFPCVVFNHAKTPTPQTHMSPSPRWGMWANPNPPMTGTMATSPPQANSLPRWAWWAQISWNRYRFHSKDRGLTRSTAGPQQSWYPPPSTMCTTDRRHIPSIDNAYCLTMTSTAHPWCIPSSSDMHSQSKMCTAHSQSQRKWWWPGKDSSLMTTSQIQWRKPDNTDSTTTTRIWQPRYKFDNDRDPTTMTWIEGCGLACFYSMERNLG